ncbi:tRNA uridine-5-carboxymethylaminomethyl(34) synthesis GTPase MnmE [Mesorhizobium sp. KR9-304]|uniref:tRNA uridine-5-carboxymethylaminomethyl(34) synthesis GTPase MnmE n=1 Tax=Mesorhizobium sp. KR9-304 TaxID=3156614 RepID=UPI0032B47790
MDFPDTIVALSSGRLPAGIAVIRISGKQTRFALETISGELPEPRLASYGALRAPAGAKIDSGLILFFPAPRSFTGEDCAEFQIHGGKAVVAAILAALTGIPGVRHAEAGEFTRRAFLNGKLDLTETEALADLISAETEAQRRLAVLNADGAQSNLYSGWRQRLIHARAMIEAELDFADELDVPGSVADIVWADMEKLLGEIREHISGFHRAEMIRDGYDVVIVGAPNAGKSSLLNALARRDAAIVSDEPGTTRDLVELALDLNGIKVRLTDTAGIREGAGKVEAIGIERARQRAESSDLVLLLIDATAEAPVLPVLVNPNVIHIETKADLVAGSLIGAKDISAVAGLGHIANARVISTEAADQPLLMVSSITGQGIDQLLGLLAERAKHAVGEAGDVLPSRLRHIELLRETAAHLESALVADGRGLELRADDLRLAADRLGRISGAVDVEDLLNVIFSQFCIGK